MLNENIFIIDHLNDQAKKIVYAPLKNYYEAIDAFYTEDVLEEHLISLQKKKTLHVINFKKATPMLSLALTTHCNLKCAYCYADGGSVENAGDSNKDMIKAVLEEYYLFLKEKDKKTCQIAFIGGCEPTCAFDLMRYAIHLSNLLALENDIVVRYTMATNGAFAEKILAFIIHHFDRVSFSFDGPREIQNYHRPRADGGESFDTVLHNAVALYHSDVGFSIHTVVSQFNVEKLRETLRFFEGHMPNAHVDFAKMDEISENATVRAPSHEAYTEAIKAVKKDSTSLKIGSTETNGFAYLKSEYCDAVSTPNWIVTIDGRINACMRDSHEASAAFDIGYYDKERQQIVLNKEKIERLKRFNIEELQGCKGCFAKYLCGGGCPYMRLKNQINCDIIKSLALKYINEKLNEKEHLRSIKATLKNLT